MEQITIKVKSISNNSLPKYETLGSSGMDIKANLDSDIVLQPLQRTLVPTGLFIELPIGYEAQIRPRSGMALKQGVTCLNTPGTIDADYRGEIKVILINLSNEAVVISNGERIAQMVIQQVVKANLILVETISDTLRGAGGFGHTGSK